MTDDEFEKTLDSLRSNAKKISEAYRKKGLGEIAVSTTVVFKENDTGSFRCGTVRDGNVYSLLGAMQLYINDQSTH